MYHNDAESALMTCPDPIGHGDGPVERRFAAINSDQPSRECRLPREEIDGERARIARELHDSLLQGFVCASMHLFAALSQIPEDSPGKTSLRHAHRLVESAIDEARNVMQDLREPERAPLNLERALALVHEEFSFGSAACFRMSVKGQRCLLNPAIREQVFLIGREALVNAFRHSRAIRIECEIQYLPDGLRVAIRDDGCGIDPEVVRSGRAAHWGIIGMRERAASIGAHLRLQTQLGFGTAVEICAPAVHWNPS